MATVTMNHKLKYTMSITIPPTAHLLPVPAPATFSRCLDWLARGCRPWLLRNKSLDHASAGRTHGRRALHSACAHRQWLGASQGGARGWLAAWLWARSARLALASLRSAARQLV